MSYQVLARKWRPKVFAELVGQQHVVRALSHALDSNRVHHAYLFTGGDLKALESSAITLAQTLNCSAPSRSPLSNLPIQACGTCSTCRRIVHLEHPDTYLLKPESRLGVITIDQIRSLLQAVHLKPAEAAYKVFILSSADRMLLESANAFLKTLEEPPERAIFLIAEASGDDSTTNQREIYIDARFAFAAPENARPAAALLAAFALTGVSFLSFAAIAAKRGETTVAHGAKSFFYSTGLAEGAETIAVFVAMCLFPAAFVSLAWLFAALCLVTVIQRSLLARGEFGK